MIVYPAIDLLAGKCVRLFQGNYSSATIYDENPVRVATQFAEQGFHTLHIVDLDASKSGKFCNLEMIGAIKQAIQINIQFGGGVRSREQVEQLFKIGVSRIVLGTIAFLQPNIVKQWMSEWGSERFVLACDIRLNEDNVPKLATQGWNITQQKSLWDFLTDYQDIEVQHVLCTDISRDGTLQGPNFDLYRECVARFPNIAFQASGGVRSLNDLNQLATIPVAGVIVGKAIYENKISLAEVNYVG